MIPCQPFYFLLDLYYSKSHQHDGLVITFGLDLVKGNRAELGYEFDSPVNGSYLATAITLLGLAAKATHLYNEVKLSMMRRKWCSKNTLDVFSKTAPQQAG